MEFSTRMKKLVIFLVSTSLFLWFHETWGIPTLCGAFGVLLMGISCNHLHDVMAFGEAGNNVAPPTARSTNGNGGGGGDGGGGDDGNSGGTDGGGEDSTAPHPPEPSDPSNQSENHRTADPAAEPAPLRHEVVTERHAKRPSELSDYEAPEIRKVDDRPRDAREGRHKKTEFRKRKHDGTEESDEDLFLEKPKKSPSDVSDSALLPDDEECRKPEEEEATLKCVKIYYASRTHSQLEQFLEEIRKTSFEPRVVQLASRQALCVNEEVRSLKNLSLMNERCLEMRKAKSSSQKASKIDDEPSSSREKQKATCKCEYAKSDAIEDLADLILATDKSVKNVETLDQSERETTACPCYASRKAPAEIVPPPFQFLLHEKTRAIWGVDARDNVVIVDEAHNLLTTVADIHSVEVTLPALTEGFRLFQDYFRQSGEEQTPPDFNSPLEQFGTAIMVLMSKLNERSKKENDAIYSMGAFISEIGLYEVNLFDVLAYVERTNLCSKFHGFFKRYCGRVTQQEKPKEEPKLSGVALLMKKRAEAKNGAVEDPEEPEPEEENGEKSRMSSPMYQIVAFLKALANRSSDGRVLVTPEDASSGSPATYRFLLLNPAEKLKDLVKDARSVLLIGGTMEPAEQLIDAFERVCEVPKDSIARFSCGHVVGDDQLTAISLARGPNGQDLTLTYANRSSPQIISSLGLALSNVVRHVPNGVVAFFASYDYMSNFTSQLKANGMYDKINNIKPIFVEKRGTSANIWNDFQRQAKTAKGAMLCAVVGGKLSEGINFSDELGRCVFMIGLPYPNKNSVELQEKMKYLDQHVRPGAGSEHYEACCMHSVNQAIGRAIRHRNDYAAIVLLD
uniref:Helicase ATP-binding domain-containing protein n=1 Tax=Steinernema glaseri TaxID=37863 RepID=A0A1I7YSE8_9BILA